MERSQSKRIVVTIDGPSACGKSSLAKELANRLKYRFLNSGLLYRAIGVFLSAAHAENEESVREALKDASFSLATRQDEVVVTYNGVEYKEDFFSPKATEDASRYAQLKPVRESLLSAQQNAFKGEPLVAEGRDMGSVVFPSAAVKIFIEVPPEERARRRLAQSNSHQSYEEILNDIIERDTRDSSRVLSPTVIPEGAVIFKNYQVSFEQAAQSLFDIVLSKLK